MFVPRIPIRRRQRIESLLGQGWSNVQIAEAAKSSCLTVRRVKALLGLKPAKIGKHIDSELRAAIQADIRGGDWLQVIARRHDVSTRTVRIIRDKMKTPEQLAAMNALLRERSRS